MAISDWLPILEPYDGFSDWVVYSDYLYSIFEDDFIYSQPKLQGKIVKVKKLPIYNNKYEAYFHLTCKDYKTGSKERNPDLRRCERIRWPRAFINNFSDTDLIKWKVPYKNTFRINIMSKRERYIVILEEKDKYFLLITAFYYDYQHSFIKKLKEYDKYKKILVDNTKDAFLKEKRL